MAQALTVQAPSLRPTISSGLESTQHVVNSTLVWPVDFNELHTRSTQHELTRVKKVNCNVKREKHYINYRLRIFGHVVQLKHDEL